MYGSIATPVTTDCNAKLASPREMRDNIANIKKNLDQYRAFKQQHVFLGSRQRSIQHGWRHGITGIENADSDNHSILYAEQKKQKDMVLKEKDILNRTRLEQLNQGFGSSKQIGVSSDNYKRTRSLLQNKPELVVDIDEKWKKKHNLP